MSGTISNQEIYDKNWPDWIDMKVHGPASRWLRSLIHFQLDKISDPEAIRSILDVGCGEGTITHYLAQWCPAAKTVGIDFSKVAIQSAQSRYRRANLQFIHDETSQELGRPYDLVTAFEVLEHLENWGNLLQRIARSAQKFVLLSFPTGRMRSFEEAMGHYRNFKRGEVEHFMSECGFETCAAWYAGFPFYSPLYRDLLNLTHPASSAVVAGPYGVQRKILSGAIFFLFRFLSTRHRLGDQFCGLFARAPMATERLNHS
jgi:SAM-dependent methyltransferase